MGIKSSMTHMDVEGPPHKHVITLWIACDAGGGQPCTTQVNATIQWDAAQLTPGAASPPGGVVASGSITWSNVTVNENGTNFVVQLTCSTAGSGFSFVTGIPQEVGGARSRPYSHVVTC